MGWVTLCSYKMSDIVQRNSLRMDLFRLSTQRQRLQNDITARKAVIESERNNTINNLPCYEEYLAAGDKYYTALNSTTAEQKQNSTTKNETLNYDEASQIMTKQQNKTLQKECSSINSESTRYSFSDTGNMIVVLADNDFAIINSEGEILKTEDLCLSEATHLMTQSQIEILTDRARKGDKSVDNARFNFDNENNIYITYENGITIGMDKDGSIIEVSEALPDEEQQEELSDDKTQYNTNNDIELARLNYETAVKEYAKNQGTIIEYYDNKLKELDKELSDAEDDLDRQQNEIQAELETITNRIQAIDNTINSSIQESGIKFA